MKFITIVGDKKKAYEYYVVAKQFDEAIKAVNDGQVAECEENELPPPAIPYRSKVTSFTNVIFRIS